MKYRDENGVFQDLYLPPTGDTLPIGSEVDYEGETVPYGWEEVERSVVLYSDSTGSNDSITLSDAYNNYTKLKIYFYCHPSKLAYFTQEIDTNVDNFNIMGFYKASDFVGQLVSSKFEMNDTSISYVNATRLNANTTYASSQVTMNTKDIYIYKVVGYKEV